MLLINDTCAMQNHMLAILFKQCTSSLVELPWMIDDATCLAIGEEESTVTHRRSIVPVKRNTKAFILVQFNR